MPILVVTNLTASSVVVQDPSGHSAFNFLVKAGQTRTGLVVSDDILTQVQPSLDASVAAGRISYQVLENPTAFEDHERVYVRVAASSPVTISPHDECVVTDLAVPGAVSVVLPDALPVGSILSVVDGKGDANVNNITITPQSGTINGSPSVIINVARGSVSLVKRANSQWLYLSYAAGAGGGGGGIDQLTGDVTAGPGSGAQAATVVALQGQGVTAASGAGEYLRYDGAGWTPTAVLGGTSADLSAGDGTTVTLGTGLSLLGGVLTATGGSGNINGSIAANEVAFGTGVDTIGGDARLNYNSGTNILSLDAGVGANGIVVQDTTLSVSSDVQAGAIALTSAFDTATLSGVGVFLRMTADSAGPNTPTIQTLDETSSPYPLDFVTGEFRLNGAAGSSGEVLASQGAGLPPVWAALPSNGALTPKLGRVLLVDDVNGNDLTGTVNGPPFQTIEAAISYINTNALTGVTVWVMPGTYSLAAGITMPATCALRGLSVQTVTIQLLNVVSSTTLLTMGENTRVEDVTLRLTSASVVDLVGIRLPGTTSVTSKLRTTVVTVDNSSVAAGSTTNVYGVLSDGTGALNAGTFSFNTLKGSTINVYSNGAGNKFGIYQPSTDANQLSTRDMNIYVRAPIDATSLGLYVGIYTDNVGSQIQTRSTTIGGSPYPAIQLKLPVNVTSTSNISLTGTYTLQGVALAVGDRVLAAGQTIGTDNGIWIVQSGAWTRAIDMAAGSAALGVYTFCNNGTYVHTGWECTTTANVGASALTFVQRYAGCDILQSAPQAALGTNGIQLGPGTDIVTKTAGTHAFTTYVTPTTLQYCLRGNIDAGTHYLWPGTLVNTMDNAEVFYRFQQKSVMQGLYINLRTAPGAGKSLTVTINKSRTGVSGTGAATLMKATISDTNTAASCYTASVDFQQYDYLSVQVDCSVSSASADLVVELDLF